jgi:hypothetical protein
VTKKNIFETRGTSDESMSSSGTKKVLLRTENGERMTDNGGEIMEKREWRAENR